MWGLGVRRGGEGGPGCQEGGGRGAWVSGGGRKGGLGVRGGGSEAGLGYGAAAFAVPHPS